MTKKIEEIANSIDMVKRFMEIPGVGPITALSFYTAIDYPERFKKSADVAAYFGLTPRQFQSGESDYSGRIQVGQIWTHKVDQFSMHIDSHTALLWIGTHINLLKMVKKNSYPI